MICSCRKQAVIRLDYAGENKCRSCLRKYLKNRARKYLKSNNFRPNSKIALIKDDSPEFLFLKDSFKVEELVPKDLSLNSVISIISENLDAYDFIFLPMSLEAFLSHSLNSFFSEMFSPFYFSLPKKVILFPLFPEKETSLLFPSRSRNTFSSNFIEPDSLKMIESLSEKYPETKFSLLKSFLHISSKLRE